MRRKRLWMSNDMFSCQQKDSEKTIYKIGAPDRDDEQYVEMGCCYVSIKHYQFVFDTDMR